MVKQDQPNIFVIWGNEIGWWNISCNSLSQMRLSNAQASFNLDRVLEQLQESSGGGRHW